MWLIIHAAQETRQQKEWGGWTKFEKWQGVSNIGKVLEDQPNMDYRNIGKHS